MRRSLSGKGWIGITCGMGAAYGLTVPGWSVYEFTLGTGWKCSRWRARRLFAADFRRQDHEPSAALCGLDNALARQALDQVGFDLVVEAGLGRGHQDFRRIRLHTLPGRRGAAELWPVRPPDESAQTQPAYSRLRDNGVLDRCGMTLLAGKAVGAPFVGAVAASLAVSEILRLLHGGGVHQVVDIDLLALDQRVACPNPRDFSSLNPSFVAISEPTLQDLEKSAIEVLAAHVGDPQPMSGSGDSGYRAPQFDRPQAV